MIVKKYPCYLQEGKTDCGAACIKSILNYYHGDYDYERLKQELMLDNHGISAYHMIAFLNRNSFMSEGKKYDWEHFVKERHLLPMIAMVKNEAFRNHYIIIYEISNKKGKILIGDPKEGLKRLSFSEFHQIFTGVVITFVVTGPVNQYQSSSLNNICLQFFYQNRKIMILLGLMILFYIFFQFITSFTMKYFLRGIELQKRQEYFYIVFLVFLIFQLLQKLYEYYMEKVVLYLKIKLQKVLEKRFYFYLLTIHSEQIQYSSSSILLNKKEEFHTWLDTFVSLIQFGIMKLPFLMILLLLFLLLFRDFFLLIFLFTIFTILYFVLFYKSIIKKEEHIRKEKEREMIQFVDTIDNLSSIQMFQLQKSTWKKYRQLLENFLDTLKLLFSQIQYIQLGYEIIFILFHLYLLLEMSLFTLKKEMLFTHFILIQSLFSYFFPLLKEVAMIPFQLSKAKLYRRRIESYFQKKSESGLFQQLPFHFIEIKNLSYTYHQKQELLTNIQLQIQRGDKILITGVSGSGKSTLLKILTGRLEVERNQIWIDNIDICDYKKESLLQNFLMITQEENLWTGTLFENLTLGRHVTKDKLLEVIRCSKIESMIQSHPKGFHQWIMNHGSQLSGGERQRIVLARTLISPFELLIIDEGLSQVDNYLERIILKKLFYTYYNKTIIVVSHKTENKDLFGRHIELEQKRVIKNEYL